MSVLYCALLLNKEKIKLAESSSGRTFVLQIKSILPQIFKNSVNDRIEFDNNYLTYTRAKEVTYLCISPKRMGDERPRRFIEGLMNKLSDLSNLIQIEKANGGVKELALQGKLQKEIDMQINNFNSGLEDSGLIVKDIQRDVDEIKTDVKKAISKQAENITNLQEQLLKTSENIKVNSKSLQKNARKAEGNTRFCCKPWVVKTTITFGVLILLFIIYIIVSFVRCDSWNAFCE